MSEAGQGTRGTVALVGGGVVGSAWAVVFARAGYARLFRTSSWQAGANGATAASPAS